MREMRDRITALLQDQSRNQSQGLGMGDITQSYLSSLSSGTGAAGFAQNYNQLQQERQRQQKDLYNMMQDEVKNGNEDAAAVDKAIRDITGNDVATYEKIASEIHNSPEPADRRNANLLASRAAAKLGYKSMAQTSDELDLAYKREQINKLRNEANKSKGNGNNAPLDPILTRQVDKDVILQSRESSAGANDSLKSLQAIESALFDEKGNPKVKTGKAQSTGQALGQILPWVDSSTYQDVQSKATKLSLDTASMLKGQTSDKDVARSLMTAPGYDKTPEANRRIIRDQKASLRVVAESPRFISAWRNRYGSTLGTDEEGRTFDEAFLDWQKSRFEELGGKTENQGEISPEDAKAELRRRGKL